MKTLENATPAVKLAYQVACNNMLAEGTTAADMAEAWALIAQEDAAEPNATQKAIVAAILKDPAVEDAARAVAEDVVHEATGIDDLGDAEIADINAALKSMGYWT